MIIKEQVKVPNILAHYTTFRLEFHTSHRLIPPPKDQSIYLHIFGFNATYLHIESHNLFNECHQIINSSLFAQLHKRS